MGKSCGIPLLGPLSSVHDFPNHWYDKGTVANHILEGLKDSGSFDVIMSSSEEEVEAMVFKGEYQLAIIIPNQLSTDLQKKINQNVEGILSIPFLTEFLKVI